ncbi:PLAC8-domain-containing protein [Marasmius fiardii PR-910]|nr:PLAC8-domain-containing protein [Marasmius fiardii PR-910]
MEPKQQYVQQQPGYTPQMMVQAGNRNAKNKPVGADGKRDWSVGLCGCGDEDGCGTCFLAWCCPCIVYGKNKKRFAALQSGRRPDRDVGGCNGDCWLHCCLTSFGWGWVLQASTRSDIRARYNISGGCCGDCCTALCCTPCELAQEHIELELEERSMGNY